MFLLIVVFFLNFLLDNSFTLSTECPDLLDGQMLDFANSNGITTYESKNGGCPRMLACDVVSAPAEANIFTNHCNIFHLVRQLSNGFTMENL